MTANHETYLLMASTQNDMEDWVKTIRRVIWAPFGGGIFGQKLEETVRYERRFGNKLAPMLVEQCVDFIRQWGLREEGLFRLPGQANLVKELQDAFDCGEKPSFDCNTDVHTVASLLKLYLRELPEPVVPFHKYDDFLASAKLLSKDDEMGMKELRNLVENLPPVNYNLLKYICRFLDEVQSYSGVNKMSVQNLATVFGPNILRPKVEDPVAIMEGTVLVQQLMAVLIGRHDVLFPLDEESPTALELVNNNNIELQRGQATTTTSAVTTVSQNTENNNTQVVRQCVWEAPESPSHRQHVDNGVSPRSTSPRNGVIGRFDITRSPPLTVKKNPAFSKGSGIVTNGSFSSSTSADPSQEKSQTLTGGGSLPVRRSGTLKGSGTKMGTSGVTGGSGSGGNGTGVVRMGISGTDLVTGSLNGRNGLWVPNGCVTLRENNKARDCSHGDQTSNQNRLSTYDNVQLNHHNMQQQNHITNTCLNSSCEDKQSVDSATWSTSSCEISLPDNSTSCRSSTTTCPEQDFYGGHYEELDGATRDNEPPQSGGKGEGEGRNSNREGSGDGAGRSSRGTSSSDNSDGYTVGNGPGTHSALHSLVASLKQEMHKQKTEYDARIKSLEQRNLELETEMVSLHEELDQERKKYTMAEIKLRNAERAKDDAERRNQMLQKEMEQFFSTFSDLTATGSTPAADPRRPDRNNTIWIQ
ncbi:rho GTPase-activating protein 24 isoform X2 [Cottoperca gobio]|nr:rho GTPase-activating protein 24 isoform X2 [Cottoperca gobio]XP_029300372.1 rho GTPase-activating protein 24 isoform X2 [Cottoperca gobio]XP_029300373.1 rho GTPase-activating protein 24 isoform X2 [Cottoperca gobio]XP_029300374.1 rho GTPase-activating protein 24 isoform X2 [Cottoperca gobio]XP_029300375.1 rho GTPase-activating protein 24 isoform X2 [Cottoperca gobio]XP_029300376.1 rho GTPase-activating protein 24 isoform X2 [Cottoperca gobio]